MPETASSKKQAYLLSRQARCYNCDRQLGINEIVKLEHDSEERELLCAKCAGLHTLTVLKKGNAKLTRLASKYSKVKYTLLKWSELWKAYERQGLLLEPDAVKKAQEELTCERQVDDSST